MANPARDKMIRGYSRPEGLAEVHTVHHGSRTTPSKVRREGLKKKGQAYVQTSTGGKTVKAHFATHDKRHAAGFAVLTKGEKGHIYSWQKKGKWHTEPYKQYVDNQYTKNKQRPTHTQQVRKTANGKGVVYGHKWKTQSGSLPKHVSGSRTSRAARVVRHGQAGHQAATFHHTHTSLQH